MEKRKVFKISIIDKEISRTEFDRNTFYTSDSELSLVFKLIERNYTYDHGEILLYNENDESFVTRKISKKENDFVYEIESDIIPHYGKWIAQLQLIKDGDVYTSKPFDFTIENDLSNLAPQPTLTDIHNWSTLKKSAAELIDEMQDIIVDVEINEAKRQLQELEREEAERQRKTIFEKNESERNKNIRVLENRQDTLENTFNSIQKEIVDARGDELTLSDRLDKKKVVTEEMTTFIRVSEKNLYHERLTDGFIHGAVNGNFAFFRTVSSSINPHPQVCIIEIEPNETYTITPQGQTERNRYLIAERVHEPTENLVHRYDMKMLFLEDGNSEPFTFTNTSTGNYLFVQLTDNAIQFECQVEKGSESTYYEQAFVIDERLLPKGVINV